MAIQIYYSDAIKDEGSDSVESLQTETRTKLKDLGVVIENTILERGVHVELTLVSGAEMRSANQSSRGKNYDTDVLTFLHEQPFGEDFLLGEIVVSLQKAFEQSSSGGWTLFEELAILIVHGLTHLGGFDHERSEDESLLQAEVELGILSLLELPLDFALIGRNL